MLSLQGWNETPEKEKLINNLFKCHVTDLSFADQEPVF